MTDKVSPKGWIVRVTTKRAGKSPSVDIYDVAIPDAADAVEAVRRACGAGPDNWRVAYRDGLARRGSPPALTPRTKQPS